MEHKRITNRFMKALADKPELETLDYKPTIAELEKAIGTPNEMDILPNGEVRPKYPTRRNGHSKLVYDKKSQTFSSIDPHPEQPTNSPLTTKEKNTPDIKPKSGYEKAKGDGQRPELIIIGTIQQLMHVIGNDLDKLKEILNK